jgi:hypothetical protein
MHTILVVLGGFLLLGLCLLAGRLVAKPIAVAALIFIPIWLGAAVINLWIGVSRAGYSVAEELPIFLLVFAIPAAAAVLIWWMFS